MNKGLEALNKLKQELYYSPNQIPDVDKYHEIIEEELLRLEYIDNSQPSEALECLEKLGAEKLARGELIRNDDEVEPYLNTIKQALTTKSDKELTFDMIREHLSFKDSGTEEYFDFKLNQKVKKYLIKIESKDTGATIHIHLDTQEEFDLLKKVMK